MEYITLNDGNSLPLLGFGTYKAGEEEATESVKLALEKGYRLLDTAARYNNEEAVGKGIRQSKIARDEIIIATKVWRETLGYDNTMKAFETSLKKLDLDYIDLYLIHWPANAKNYSQWQEVNAETWRAMEALQDQGLIKSIGVSNFWEEHLKALFETANVKPAVNQIEFHPGYWQPELTQFCRDHDIVVEGWSPLAKGKVFGNDLLKQIAEKHQKSVSQICLRWAIEHRVISIPKSTTPERIEENLQIFDFRLTAEEIQAINEIPEMGFSGELPNHWPDRYGK